MSRLTFHLSMSVAALLLAACARDRDETSSVDQPMDTTMGGEASGDVSRRPAGTPTRPMQRVLDELASLGGKPIETLTPAVARQQPTPTDAVKGVLRDEGKPTTPPPGVKAVDRTIRGAVGEIPARIYTPESGNGPFPVVVYYHGGGWVIADKEVYDAGARALSNLASAVVVSIDYRLAPEHPFPAAHDDAFAAYQWALANAQWINGDPARVALAGESAGGNLAVATAMTARDRDVQKPFAVIAVYPIASVDTTRPSYETHANAKPLNRAMMSWFFDKYLRDGAGRRDPRINLVDANLRDLPPVTIINAEIDPLRSEGELLAERLRDADVDVDQKTYDGVAHEFFGMAAVVPKAKEAQEQAGNRLKSTGN